MTHKQNLFRLLLTGLITLSIGGFLLHFSIHHFSENRMYFIPLFSGFLSIFIVPALFMSRKTIHYGYVLNGMLVIIGIITMTHYMFTYYPAAQPLTGLITDTVFAYMFFPGCKFCLGKALFDLEMFGADAKTERKGIWYRYPNNGWWAIHLVLIGLVYALGNILWRQL
jgi:hypothetical protein